MAVHTQTETEASSRPTPPDSAAAAFLDRLRSAAILVALDGSILHRNEAASHWLGEGTNLQEGLAGVRFLGPFDDWPSELRRVVDGEHAPTFECVLTPTDAQSPTLVTIRCISAMGGEPSGRADAVVLVIEEGAKQADMEERIEVSRRLASLGKLAARVAHELNNPLDGILRYVNLAMRLAGEAPDDRLKNYLTESRTGLMRMVQIISDLLEFSRSTDGEFEQTDINEVVEQAIRSLASNADANGVIVAADFHRTDMPCVRGSRLYQVVCNLIKNAVDAMPDGGRLALTTGIVSGEVMIEVADTGAGLPDDAQKVFEPFFTTKGAGKGTGIGLAICKDFVEDMNGTIHAANGAEGGAVFTVRLPLDSCLPPTGLTEPAPDKP